MFEGSWDRDTHATHVFYKPMTAHYIRILPAEWFGKISVRIELLGCIGNYVDRMFFISFHEGTGKNRYVKIIYSK